MTSLVVLDAGSRYGIHPSWEDLRKLAKFYLFEMDQLEAKRLQKKYSADKNIIVHPIALHKESTVIKFTVMKHRALSSIHDPNHELLDKLDYMTDGFSTMEEHDVIAKAADDIFDDEMVHFLKLDVEGAEANVLKGAESIISRSVLGIRSEVQFAPVFSGTALFGDLDAFMRDRGFELLNLDYSGAGNRSGKYAEPNRYGQLMTTDAVWILSKNRLFDHPNQECHANVVRQSIFLMLNNAKDLAIELLLDAQEETNFDISDFETNSLESFLHKKVLLHFKNISELPMFSQAEIGNAYEKIFSREFPTLNRFYESEYFD